ncbi:MAG TPA: hypothetical protein VNC78_05460 [Actinomycetota bacterium]|nr:hypothetical protein [Actinomycetota bacterium]
MSGTWEAPLLIGVLPEIASELETALEKQGDPDLATQIRGLRIESLCGCDDEFCGSFHARGDQKYPWSDVGDLRSVAVEVAGIVVLDVVAGTIRYVEVIDRPEVRKELRSAVPRRRTDPRLP